ncbi:MAG: hypothetical protein KME10_22970 [Plectolyngbya sp. WJT66-NPBG17]|jgi:hypothetical protein|nr:hypothetical protein [Plectolyngbya sp. WJT66-NPBG17]MBW4527984.1 hypothetical protein [Phormidium tanganyikae FI6-MK23]
MNSHDRINFVQRSLAVLSATGTAALMTLPAFAQALPTQGVVNNGDVNRSGVLNNQTPSSTSDNCAPYTSGGVGGPIDSQSSNTQTSPSSYDTARTGIAEPNSNSNVNQFPSSATLGQPIDQTAIGSTTNNNNRNVQSATPNRQFDGNNRNVQSATPNRQFDGNNRSAAVAYRSNGPAGTSGHEVKMNLDAFQQRQNSYPTAYNLGAPQASAPLPVACAPR